MSKDVWLFKCALFASVLVSLGARYEAANFVVDAPTAEMARQVAAAAEHYRKELAVEWLGQEMPRWCFPCRVSVREGNMGAGGATTFCFERGRTGQMEVHGWNMRVQGPLARILDSVLPHEISHTIFACHFRRPLPRWADEGAATLAENESERQRQRLRAHEVLQKRQRIPLKTLFSITEYPSDMEKVLTLYAQGYSVAEFLIQRGGKSRYLNFVAQALRDGWDKAIHGHYGWRDVDELESRWGRWVMAGSPDSPKPAGPLVAEAGSAAAGSSAALPVVRAQSPEPIAPVPNWRIRPVVTIATALSRPVKLQPTGSATISRTGGHSRPMRGEGLHAPDPRSVIEARNSSKQGISRQLRSMAEIAPSLVSP